MKQIILFLAAVMMGTMVLEAQTDKNKKQPPRPKPVPVFLGGQYDGGNISRDVFNTMLRKGLNGKDSVGKQYKVNGFAFTYVERNLYEDSVGNLKVVPDYLIEYCYGDSLTSFLLDNISERSKSGDTVYIDKINLLSPDGAGAAGKAIKLVLTK